jgi:hypothetical protein
MKVHAEIVHDRLRLTLQGDDGSRAIATVTTDDLFRLANQFFASAHPNATPLNERPVETWADGRRMRLVSTHTSESRTTNSTWEDIAYNSSGMNLVRTEHDGGEVILTVEGEGESRATAKLAPIAIRSLASAVQAHGYELLNSNRHRALSAPDRRPSERSEHREAGPASPGMPPGGPADDGTGGGYGGGFGAV